MPGANRKQEENTKIKLVLPLLQDGLGYSDLDEFDFEHNVRNKRADIAIIINDALVTLIEVKDKSENLDHHIDQAIEYGQEKQLEFVCLTNGAEFRIYATFAKGVVSASDRVLGKYLIEDPRNPPAELKKAFQRNALPDFVQLKKCKQRLRPHATEPDLTRVLVKSTEDLFNVLFPQFTARYKSDARFKEKIDNWAATVKLDIKDKGLVEKLCKEGAYSLINRVLFYRICEDRGDQSPQISENNLKSWREMVEKPSKQLSKLFQMGAKEYETFYNSPLFNSITFDDVEWNETTIFKVLARFANVDFGQLDNDLIGQAYEHHIPVEERKRLGQFYTPQFIVEYLVEHINLKADSKILDPSCGSGAFLTHCLKALSPLRNNNSSAAVEENLYGIDINPFATQLTTMNLLLGTLGAKKKPRHLNILAADSLIDKKLPDMSLFDGNLAAEAAKNIREIKDFISIKYDAVVGNPPYRCFGLRSNKALKETYEEYLRGRWQKSAEYKISYYPLFIERSIELLCEGGILAFILPDSFLIGKYFSNVRKFILENTKVKEIVFCRENFWEDAEVGCPTLLILQRESNKLSRDNNSVTVKLADTAANIKTRKFIKNKYQQSVFNRLLRNRFELYFDPASQELVESMRSATTKKLGDVAIGYSGVIAAPGFKKEDIISGRKVNSFYQKGLHSGSEIVPYKIEYKGGWIRIDERALRSGYDPEIMENPKLVVRQTGDSLIASVDRKRLYHVNNVHSISPKSPDVSLEWLCLVLNSAVMNRFYHLVTMELGRVMAQTDIDQLEDLPYLAPSPEVISHAEELHSILSTSDPKSRPYLSARNEAETLVATAYNLTKKLTETAFRMVKGRKLAA
ncbi:MAG: N-6 DNA methylase [Bdellovibrionota bacterium]